MQRTNTYGPNGTVPRDNPTVQSLLAMLALAGTKRMDVESLRGRTRLTPRSFESLLEWLQREYLVDVFSSLEGDKVEEKVGLTEKGEEVLLSLLENTCELPDLR